MVKVGFHFQQELHDKLIHVFRELQVLCTLEVDLRQVQDILPFTSTSPSE